MKKLDETGRQPAELSTAVGDLTADGSAAVSYEEPTVLLIGRSERLLQGSGRHKNDDTGSRGFVVDQH